MKIAYASLLLAVLIVPIRADDPRNSRGSTTDSIATVHWAFRPLSNPPIPQIEGTDWARNPVDKFILAAQQARGLRPLPIAGRMTLIRRVTFDLTGLPPTPDEVLAFVGDESPDAYEKLIDRLLASPAYGERWAQHWLDIARFAETDGFEHDHVRPNAWRFRDWVIDALNADMPYDEFVRVQIAGDEQVGRIERKVANSQSRKEESEQSSLLAPLRLGDFALSNPSRSKIATGFLLCGPDMPDINLQDERRHNVLNEMTATVGSVFLGLQLGCAQCHDHKFDPITMADFYRLRAFFEPADFFDEAPLVTPEELAERERLEAPAKAERERIEKELKTFDAMAHERLNKDPQVKISRDELVSALSETEKQEFRKLTDELKRLNTSNLPPLPMGRVMREKGGTPRASHVMLRGDFRQPGPRVTPAFPAIANPWNAPVEVPESVAPSSGRRTALADWLTRPDHPLTTRVIVNRVWQFHFGQGLVRTASDFGTMGESPSHAELLDLLATEFTRPAAPPSPQPSPPAAGREGRVRGADVGGLGWSLKRLHKLILTSATYMQASRPTEPGWTAEQRAAAIESWKKSREVDPENRLLARMNRLRLDGESIRDAMLAACNRLSPRRGGPGVRPPLPDELIATLLKNQWTVTPEEEDHRRRSIYIFVRRNLRYPLFDVFDRPDTNASCPQRPRSTTAPQSLTLFNSQFSFDSARELTGYVLARVTADSSAQVDLAYRRTLGRPPTAKELAAGTAFLKRQIDWLLLQSRLVDPAALPREPLPDGVTPAGAESLVSFCLALFNLSEFVYID